MNTIQKSLAAAVVAAFGITLAPSSEARSTIAWSGSPESPGDASCFTESYGTVTNTCSSNKTWEMALPVDAAGTWSVSVNVSTTSDPSSVKCVLYGVNSDGTYSAGGTLYQPTSAGAGVTISMAVAVPSAGAMFLGCFLNTTTKVNTVNWSFSHS